MKTASCLLLVFWTFVSLFYCLQSLCFYCRMPLIANLLLFPVSFLMFICSLSLHRKKTRLSRQFAFGYFEWMCPVYFFCGEWNHDRKVPKWPAFSTGGFVCPAASSVTDGNYTLIEMKTTQWDLNMILEKQKQKTPTTTKKN